MVTELIKTSAKYLVGLSIVVALAASAALGQQTSRSASATAVNQSSGRASTIQIKQNFLQQRVRLLQRQIDDALRCISTASNPTILRDPEGNINKTPQTDLVNCSRQLALLRSQLEGLQRQSQQLAQDAQVQALAVQRKLQQTKTRNILEGGSGQ